MGESATITVGAAQYKLQVFALDTLYNRVPNWADVGESASWPARATRQACSCATRC